jgi:hypothetical protein
MDWQSSTLGPTNLPHTIDHKPPPQNDRPTFHSTAMEDLLQWMDDDDILSSLQTTLSLILKTKEVSVVVSFGGVDFFFQLFFFFFFSLEN